MRKKLFVLRIILLGICLVWPVFYSLNEFILRRFPEMLVPIPFCAAAAVPFIVALVLTFRVPKEEYAASDSVFAAVLAFAAIIAAMFYFTLPGVLFGLFSALCTFIMLVRICRFKTLRIILTSVSVVLLAALLFCFTVRLDGFDNELIASIPSPDGGRYVEVVDEHGEFLGGNVSVTLYDRNDTLFGILRFCRHGSTLWDESRMSLEENGMLRLPEVEWKDHRTILINGTERHID